MLWIGWFGFNAGSALGANGGAGMAMLVTHISAATASLVWMFIEWKRFGKPSLIGIVTGMVAGLATVTPASGYIGVPGGLILGFLGGLLCYLAVDYIRGKLQIDDSLDVFAVHGVGGILGTLLVAFLATSTFSGLFSIAASSCLFLKSIVDCILSIFSSASFVISPKRPLIICTTAKVSMIKKARA